MKAPPPMYGAVLLLSLNAIAAESQNPLFDNCDAQDVWTMVNQSNVAEPWLTFHPRTTEERARAAWADRGGPRAAMGEIERAFVSMAALSDIDSGRRTRVMRTLDSAEEDLQRHGRTAGGLSNQGLFDPTPGPDEFRFATGTADAIVVSSSDQLPTIRAICWTAIAAHELLGWANAPARRAVLRELTEAVSAWNAFNEVGYAQYPWEIFLNRPDGLKPPSVQYILFHPGAGLEVAGISELETAATKQTVVMEVAGLLIYNSKRTFYTGVSAHVSLAGDLSPGFGPLLHVGPFIKIGYAFRSEPANTPDQDGLLITADLLQLLTGAPDLYEAARESVQSLLSAALSRGL